MLPTIHRFRDRAIGHLAAIAKSLGAAMAYYQYISQVTAAVTLVTTAETAIVTSPAPDERVAPGLGILVSGFINVLAGTGTTAIVVKIRAGVGTGGTSLLSTTYTLAAGASANIPIDFVDTSGAFPIGQYTVTLVQTGASANGSATGLLGISPLEEA